MVATKKEIKNFGFTKKLVEQKPTQASVQKTRKIVDGLLMQALAEPRLRAELKRNPTKVFAKAGLPLGAAEDLERQLTIDGVRLNESCTISCIFTCWFSDWFAVPTQRVARR